MIKKFAGLLFLNNKFTYGIRGWIIWGLFRFGYTKNIGKLITYIEISIGFTVFFTIRLRFETLKLREDR